MSELIIKLSIVFSFFFTASFAQDKDTCIVVVGKDTIHICDLDKHLENTPKNVVRSNDKLVEYLTEITHNDYEKTYMFYSYIGENITYDLVKARQIKRKKVKKILSAKELLTKKKGVCGDVSYLFQDMCERSGVTSRVVFGYSSGKKIKLNLKKKRMNHAWNAVCINDQWFHIDATWAIKNYSNPKKNKKFVNYYYYLTPSEKFNKAHLPADPVWQLTEKPESFSHFKWKYLSLRGKYYCSSFSFEDTLSLRLQLNPVDELIASANSSLNFIPENKYTIIQLLNWPAEDFTDKKKQDKKTLELDDYYKAEKIYKSIISYCKTVGGRKSKKYAAYYSKKLEKVLKKIIQLEKKRKQEKAAEKQS